MEFARQNREKNKTTKSKKTNLGSRVTVVHDDIDVSIRSSEEFCSSGVMAHVLDSSLVVSEFELQLQYYVPFWERYELLSLTSVVLLQCFSIK